MTCPLARRRFGGRRGGACDRAAIHHIPPPFRAEIFPAVFLRHCPSRGVGGGCERRSLPGARRGLHAGTSPPIKSAINFSFDHLSFVWNNIPRTFVTLFSAQKPDSDGARSWECGFCLIAAPGPDAVKPDQKSHNLFFFPACEEP